MLCRASLVFAIQTWLAETPEQTRTSGTPSYLSVGMAGQYVQPLENCLRLIICRESHGRCSGNIMFVPLKATAKSTDVSATLPTSSARAKSNRGRIALLAQETKAPRRYTTVTA